LPQLVEMSDDVLETCGRQVPHHEAGLDVVDPVVGLPATVASCSENAESSRQ